MNRVTLCGSNLGNPLILALPLICSFFFLPRKRRSFLLTCISSQRGLSKVTATYGYTFFDLNSALLSSVDVVKNIKILFISFTIFPTSVNRQCVFKISPETPVLFYSFLKFAKMVMRRL